MLIGLNMKTIKLTCKQLSYRKIKGLEINGQMCTKCAKNRNSINLPKLGLQTCFFVNLFAIPALMKTGTSLDPLDFQPF